MMQGATDNVRFQNVCLRRRHGKHLTSPHVSTTLPTLHGKVWVSTIELHQVSPRHTTQLMGFGMVKTLSLIPESSYGGKRVIWHHTPSIHGHLAE